MVTRGGGNTTRLLVLAILGLGAFIAYQNWEQVTSWFEDAFGGFSNEITIAEPELYLQAWELWKVYETNSVLYETSYQGKIVQVTGKIQRIEDGKVYLESDDPRDITTPMFAHLETVVLKDLSDASLAAVGEIYPEAVCRVGKVRKGSDSLTILDYTELEMEDCIHPSEIPPTPTPTKESQ